MRLAQPVIEAVSSFEREHGAPPHRLEDLVPSHLATLPIVETFNYGPLMYSWWHEGWELRLPTREMLSGQLAWKYVVERGSRSDAKSRAEWVEERLR